MDICSSFTSKTSACTWLSNVLLAHELKCSHWQFACVFCCCLFQRKKKNTPKQREKCDRSSSQFSALILDSRNRENENRFPFHIQNEWKKASGNFFYCFHSFRFKFIFMIEYENIERFVWLRFSSCSLFDALNVFWMLHSNEKKKHLFIPFW